MNLDLNLVEVVVLRREEAGAKQQDCAEAGFHNVFTGKCWKLEQSRPKLSNRIW